nr:uncharacterized protein LOC123770784 [Procambarus clarkii]
MVLYSSFLLAIVYCTLAKSARGQDCVWDRDEDFPVNPPILFDEAFEIVRPVLEGSYRMVRVSAGSRVTVACPGTLVTNLGVSSVTAACAGGVLLAVDETEWELAELGCTDKVSESIQRDLGSCGSGNVGVVHAIGFEVDAAASFYELIRVCFEPQSETTLYSQNVIHGANIAAKDVEASRPSFKSSSGFFSVSMSSVYAQSTQLDLMTNLLGDADLANEVIDVSKQFYFAKGHMAPDADFVTVAEQDATYYFINALPQWQAFNNGNWKYLEYATRDLATKHNSDLTIYSGGWGVLELDDINNNPVEIYLGLSEDKKVVPAPAITWKVVHDEGRQRAAAVVGVNNPHLTRAPAKICSDLCDSLGWIDFDVNDLVSGFTYCCSVDDLRQAVPHVPDLGPVALLTD